MGRSRGVFHSDDDPTQRSRRKKNASLSGGDNIESGVGGQGSGDGKRALYHCNYCNKDITGRIRIKCAMCPDFDLCIECFSVGAEMQPHKSNHFYRVMDTLSFPLITPLWNADEEILLLEGLEMYGLGNWAEVAEHVGTKNKQHCITHYTTVYLNSPFFPLPDMTHVVGKNRNDLLAMAKENNVENKGSTPLGDHTIKPEPPFSPMVKVDDLQKGGPSSRFIQNIDSQVERNPIGKKPPKEEDSSLVSLSGYNPKRREFDPEYDVDAEKLLADMEFKEADTEDEHKLKLRVLHIYCKRLDERTRRKDFIIERDLLYPSPFEKNLCVEEKTICRQYDPFMRFHSKEDHEDMLQTVIAEHRTLKRIKELEEARAAGCRTSTEADKYLEKRRKIEAEQSRVTLRAKEEGGEDTDVASQVRKIPNSAPADDLARCPGKELLSEEEKRACHEMKISPERYLKMQETLSVNIFSGQVASKADAHELLNTEPSIIDRIYDMLLKKGVAPPSP